MTDAFCCDGCEEYFDHQFRFISVEMDTEWIQSFPFDLDDLGPEAFAALPDDKHGDFCPECGRDVLTDLIERFQRGESNA